MTIDLRLLVGDVLGGQLSLESAVAQVGAAQDPVLQTRQASEIVTETDQALGIDPQSDLVASELFAFPIDASGSRWHAPATLMVRAGIESKRNARPRPRLPHWNRCSKSREPFEQSPRRLPESSSKSNRCASTMPAARTWRTPPSP